MTVSSTTTKNSYSGNGSLTVFAYGFKIFDEEDIEVILRNDTTGTETVQTITTNYSVSNVGNANGGNVTFVTAPASGITVVLRRASPLTQTTDYTPNDPFPAESHEDALDKLTFISQQIQEEVDRSIKLSRTNTMTSTEFTVGAADRANKILAFDGNGEINVAQELGAFQGNWSSGTAFAARDIVKDTSTNNIFIANTAHTSSGSQPLTTNTDSAKWDLLVDAASATTAASSATSSATAAAASASAASTSASNASTSQTNAATSASNASTSETNASNSATAASNAQAAAEAALDTFTDQYLGSLASDPTTDLDGNALTDGDLYFNTTDNVMKVYDLGNTTWKQLTPTAGQQTNIDTVSGIAANVTTVAGISGDVTTVSGNTANIGTVAGSISNVNAVGTNITSVVNAANSIASINNFGDTYFVSATAPASPTLGDLWFDTANNIMKVYGSGGFVNAGSSVNGTANRYAWTVGTASGTYTGSTTVFPATYDAGYADVFLNGVKLLVGTDVTATNGTDVTLATAAAANDIVEIVAYGTFTAATALSLGDNEKIQLGASQDLQIYHDGSDSYVDDTGTGALILRGNANVTIGKYTGETMGFFEADGAVSLYHNNAIKLATTATGVDVTGAVTADGLTVGGTGGAARLNAVAQNWPENALAVYSANVAGQTNFAGIAFFNQDTDSATGNVADIYTNPTGTLSLTASGNPAIQLKYGSAGISGGTSALTVDNAGRIGIGTASPTLDGSLAGLSVNASGTVLHIDDGDGATLKLTDPASGANRGFGISLQGTEAVISNCESGSLRFGTGNTERLRIDSSGNVTMPYQPSFAATRNQGDVSNAVYVYTNVYHNIGGHYNNSNGRFTAPVTGSYFISTNHMSSNGATYNNTEYQIRVNGSVHQFAYSSSGGNVHHRWNWHGVIHLQAGDYIDVFVPSGFSIYGQSNLYQHFSGYLIG
jgi:hypothetical protein